MSSVPDKRINVAADDICGLQKLFGGGTIMFPKNPENARYRVDSTPGKSGYIPGFFVIGCVAYQSLDDLVVHRSVRVFEIHERAYGQMINVKAGTISPRDFLFVDFTSVRGKWAN